jgi:hypothetical protein
VSFEARLLPLANLLMWIEHLGVRMIMIVVVFMSRFELDNVRRLNVLRSQW